MTAIFRLAACVLAATATVAASVNANAAISVRDDDGVTVTLQLPARRIIALAPHVTELLFAAGGGERIVGVVSYSDFPEQARRIASIGDSRQIDLERVIALKPDLLVVWRHGSSERQLAQLRALGIPMFHSAPGKLDDIADSLLRLGQLMGTQSVARPAATALRSQLAALAAQYGNRAPVSMFYQLWDKPLYTLNGAHIVSDAMRLCGGVNIFAAMTIIAPVVDIEAVLQQNPEAIFGSSEKTTPPAASTCGRRSPTSPRCATPICLHSMAICSIAPDRA